MTFLPDALFAHGFTDLISVIPPGATLAPSSTIAPAQVGKVPGRRTPNGTYVGYDWRRASHTAEEVHRWMHDGCNVGLRADRFPAVDIDCADEALAGILEQAALATLGPAPIRTGRAPKRLLMYRTAEPFGRMRLWIQKGETSHLVEILGQGQQYVVHGIHPATERPYAWDVDPAGLTADGLTAITRAQADAFLDELAQLVDLLGVGSVSREGDGKPLAAAVGDQAGLQAPSLATLRDAVRSIPNTNALFPDRSSYLKVGYAIRAAAGADLDEGYAIFAEWAAKWEGNGRFAGNEPDVVRADWRRMRGPYAVGWPFLAELARGFGFATADLEFTAVADAPEVREEGAPHGSDQWLAEVVALRQRRTLRFVPQKGVYLVWHAGRWQLDAELLAEDIVKRELKQLGVEALRAGGASAAEVRKAEELAQRICSAGKVEAVARLVRSDRSIAVSMHALDHDPWTLNTPAGLVDLRTGQMGPADPDALCTKLTAVAPDASTGCPRWLAFLAEATGGDAALVGYLQRLCGYALTGSTREQHLTFIYGPGGNGKSIFLNVLTGILGDYAKTAAMDTFTASYGDKHSTDIAALVGARLVTASETGAGKRWDEARLKSLTGGEPVTARFMRQDNFTFVPAFKLVFVGNHKPEVRDVDAAIRRRIQLVPFTVTPKVVDKELGARLREEWPAILAWMLEGCLQWQRDGLQPPESVRLATEDYFAEEDAVGRWLRERTEPDPNGTATTAALFQDWTEWAKRTGEYVGSLKRLSAALVARKFTRWQDPKTRRYGFAGLTLKPAALEEFQ